MLASHNHLIFAYERRYAAAWESTLVYIQRFDIKIFITYADVRLMIIECSVTHEKSFSLSLAA